MATMKNTGDSAGPRCLKADTELFFSENPEQMRDAMLMCVACTVRDQCLTDALARGERHGIWGGTLPAERRHRRTRDRTCRRCGFGTYYVTDLCGACRCIDAARRPA